MLEPKRFQQLVLRWFAKHGRKDLPWQQNANAYSIWVSEIMLQQTQVNTVIPYFKRFIKRFPNIHSLASAEQDTVLQLWTGLGYYARARNLHRSAQHVVDDFSGVMPSDVETLMSLPGIGRSTAGAIVALSQNTWAPILDGNVKRVLSRVFKVSGWSGERETLANLWSLTEMYTPQKHVAAYTQAMMDLGAMICRRGKPDCTACPLISVCQAYQTNTVADFPQPRPKKTLPEKSVYFLLLRNQNQQLYLLQRPSPGIWGGLWCFPECPTDKRIKPWSRRELGFDITVHHKTESFRHTFSHYHLDITPVHATIELAPGAVAAPTQHWYTPGATLTFGVAAPVKKLLLEVATYANDPLR